MTTALPDQPVRAHLLKVKELWDPSPPRPSVSCYNTHCIRSQPHGWKSM